MNSLRPLTNEENRQLLSLLKDGDTPTTVDLSSDKYTLAEATTLYQLIYRTSRDFAVRAIAFERGTNHPHNEY